MYRQRFLQYIGARYVPKFYQNSQNPDSTEWEPNVEYEYMTWVSLSNGNMYLSKDTVPASVGSPANNPTYWIPAGQFNAYINSLQSQINDMNDGNVSGSLQNQINTINDEVDDINENLYDFGSFSDPNRKFLFVGDSYDTFVSNRSWIDETATILGLSYKKISQGGYGFDGVDGEGSGNWVDLINAATYTNPEKFTDVVICGGLNDGGLTYTQLSNAIDGFRAAVLAKLPNVKRFHLGYIGFYAGNDDSFKGKVRTCAAQYEKYCNAHKDFIWIENMKYIFTNTQLLGLPTVVGGPFHPVADGVSAIRDFLVEYLKTGHADYRANYTYITALSSDFNGTEPIQLEVSIHNSIMEIRSGDYQLNKVVTNWAAFSNKALCVNANDTNMPLYSRNWKQIPLFSGSSGTNQNAIAAMVKFNSNTPVILSYKTISTSDTNAVISPTLIYNYEEL